ncbi:MAG: O-antigen ligase family protein, partial [Candidatus Desantisbacteria bacterium]
YNSFGGFLALVLPLIIVLSKNIKLKITAVVMFAALISTYSRGSALGVIGGVITIAVLKKDWQILCKTAIFSILAIILLILCLSPFGLSWSLFNRMATRYSDTHSSVGSRFLLWQAGWKMISSHPLTGVGIGTFAENLPFYASPNTEMQDTAHNLYLNIASDMGISGLLIYLAILAIILYKGIKNHQTLRDEYLKHLNLGLLGGICAFSVNNLFTPLMIRGVAIPLWIFIGLIMVLHRCQD